MLRKKLLLMFSRLYRAQWQQRKRFRIRALVIFAGAAVLLVVGAFWYVRKERQEADSLNSYLLVVTVQVSRQET